MASLSPIINYFPTTIGLNPSDAGLPILPDTEGIIHGSIYSTIHALDLLPAEDSVHFSSGGPLTLLGSACEVESSNGSSQSCTQACMNTTHLFSSWEHQWTCLTLSSLAVYWPLAELNYSVTETIENAVHYIHTGGVASFDGKQVFTQFQKCAVAGCVDSGCN